MTRPKKPLTHKDGAKAILEMFDGMDVCWNDPLCVCRSKWLGKPVMKLVTGDPFWRLTFPKGAKRPDWAVPDYGLAYRLAVYDRTGPFTAEELERELKERREEPVFNDELDPIEVPKILDSARAPFVMNKMVLEGSSVMLIDPALYGKMPRIERRRTWRATFVIKCPLDSFLAAFAPDRMLRQEDGRLRADPRRRPPSDLAKTIGMGYHLEHLKSPRGKNEELWRIALGLRDASAANGLEADWDGRQSGVRLKDENACDGDGKDAEEDVDGSEEIEQ
jgi:hypothetical protein